MVKRATNVRLRRFYGDATGTVRAALDSDRDYRAAIVGWFAEHGVNAWNVVDAAISVDESIGPRLECLILTTDEDGRLTGGQSHIARPLIRRQPEPVAGWTA